MQHAFATLAEADQFVTDRHPGAATMTALTRLLGNPVMLDRHNDVVVRVYDWSDDKEEPVVNVERTPARSFAVDQDLADQIAVLLERGSADPELVRAVLTELTEIGCAEVPGRDDRDPLLGLLLTSESLRLELETALAVVDAVRDHAARALWTKRSEAGADLAKVASEAHLEPAALAAMVAAARRRTFDL